VKILLIVLLLSSLLVAVPPEGALGAVGGEVAGEVGVYRLELVGSPPETGQVVEIWRGEQRLGEAFVISRPEGWRLNLKGVFACKAGDQVMVTGRRSRMGSQLEDRSRSTPDLPQNQPELPGGGEQYCCPTAVANSLLWLGDNGYPALRSQTPLQVIKELGERMGTDDNGTSMRQLRDGLDSYLSQRGLNGTTEFRGWLGGSLGLGPNPYPSLDWMGQCLAPAAVGWLNFGFYGYDSTTDTYTRFGGHWVTLVGISSRGLAVHDPAARAGRTPSTQHVVVEELGSGTLAGQRLESPIPAKGFFRVVSGLALPRSRPLVILDGVLKLHLD